MPKYLLDLQTFVVGKLPDDGTQVLKHIGVGTRYELCFATYFILISAFCWFLKIQTCVVFRIRQLPDWISNTEEHSTAPYSRNFTENKLPQYFVDVPLATQAQKWLQHYRAPPYIRRGKRRSE